jgi:hypothetical protein
MATERFNETTEAPGGIPRDVASAWAIELWEKLQDVYSNEAAWALLDGSRSTSMDEVALATGTIENARKAIEKAIEQRDAALSDALGHLEALTLLLGSEDLTGEMAMVTAEAVAFLQKHGHGPGAPERE